MAEHKPSLWLRYVDDTCVIWPHGLDSLQEFCYHINSLIPTFKITMEIETDSVNPLLDVLVIREGNTMNIKIYRKPTHTGCYLHFQSKSPRHVKRGIVQSLYHRPNVIYQEQQVRFDEIVTLTRPTAQCLSHWVFAINKPKRNVLRKKGVQPLGFISVPYIRGVS